MERLNHQAGLLLKKVIEEGDRCAIQEPMAELKMLWDNLDKKIIGRQVRRGGQEVTDGIQQGVKRAVSLQLEGSGCHIVMV